MHQRPFELVNSSSKAIDGNSWGLAVAKDMYPHPIFHDSPAVVFAFVPQETITGNFCDLV